MSNSLVSDEITGSALAEQHPAEVTINQPASRPDISNHTVSLSVCQFKNGDFQGEDD